MSADISSASNPRIRSLAALKERRARDAERRFLIEGARELARAIDAGVAVKEIILAEEFASDDVVALAAGATASVITVGEAPFAKISMRQNPDGIVGVASTWDAGLDGIDRDLVLIAEAVEKPGNLGAILRTADAAGAAVVAADPTLDLFNPNVVRASQGALFTVPVAVADAASARRWAQGRGTVIVTMPDATDSLWEADLTGPVAIVVGSEHSGVSDHWLEAGRSIQIPMQGASDSLNTSVAAAIVLFEAVRQRES